VSRRVWTGVRRAGALLLLAALVLRLGGEPFLRGLRAVDPVSLLAVAALTALTTVAAAWRWQAVAGSLGDPIPLPDAVAAYYRSQFLNSVLPGGVVGDVHRGIDHGLDRGDVRGAIRAVVWERVLGQAVQVLVTAVVVLLVTWAAALPALLLAGALLVAAAPVLPKLLPRRLARHRRALPRIVLASLGTTAGHASVFLVAAHAAGISAAPVVLLPLALLVLVAMAVPLSIAGWGIREGAAAWLFGAAGLGPEAGVTVATAYGTMALVAVAPGAALLLVGRLQAQRRESR
jgi:uncharacterized membrane protein YbhN (UPF0104 family)